MWLVALLQMVAESGVSWVTFGPDKQTKLALRESRRLRAAAAARSRAAVSDDCPECPGNPLRR